jgi:prepilin-type N-terminal cleavage/methylation domain-containing protein
MLKRIFGFTLIECLIALALVLCFVFAGVFGSYERRLFAALGGDDARLLMGIPLACVWLYLNYRQGRFVERVPGWLVIGGACVIVFGVGIIACLLTA